MTKSCFDNKFNALMNALADSVETATDSEILEESKNQSPENIREIIFGGMEKYRKKSENKLIQEKKNEMV